jgi:hypothetical protein
MLAPVAVLPHNPDCQADHQRMTLQQGALLVRRNLARHSLQTSHAAAAYAERGLHAE